MRRNFFLGCDVGATGSRAVLVDDEAKLVSSHLGNAGNPHVVGFEESAKFIASLIAVVLANRTSQLSAVTVCISGAEPETLRERYAEYFRQYLSLPDAARVIVLHDVVAPLGLIIPAVAQSLLEYPTRFISQFVTLIAGTGSVAASFAICDGHVKGSYTCVQGDEFSIEMRRKCGGWGPILGDAGSAYAIVVHALNLSLRIMDGIEDSIPRTSYQDPVGAVIPHLYSGADLRRLALSVLSAAIDHYLEACNSGCNEFEKRLDSLITFLNNRTTTRGQIASLASKVAGLASEGNDLCIQVFREAGKELGQLLLTASSLTSEDEPRRTVSMTHVCAIGGVFNAWDEVPAFADTFRHTIKHVLSHDVRVFMLKDKNRNERIAGGEQDAVAFSCASLGALTLGVSNEHWQMKASRYLRQVL